MKNPKDKFYRSLDLDLDTKKILKWYRGASKDLQNDKYDKEQDDESIQ